MKDIGLRSLVLIAVVGLVGICFPNFADAKGRAGSRRVYSGRGKGSHYVGGKK